MWGALQAELLMETADMIEKEQAKLNETEEGRAKLAHDKAVSDSFNNIPVGAKAYRLVKISRHQNPENPHPAPLTPGTGGSGYIRVFTDEMIKFQRDQKDTPISEYKEFPGIPWECQLEAKPKIDSVFMVGGEHGNWLRTSLVRSYYVHDDPEGYKEHPDKLVLPKEFPVEAVGNLPLLEAGDIVLSTMNSLYLCRYLGPKYDYSLSKDNENDEELGE